MPRTKISGRKRLRVGLPDWVDPDLLHCFPEGIELVPIPSEPVEKIPIEFWIPPLTPTAASRIFPYIEGVNVAQSLLAGVDWLLKIVSPGLVVCDAQGVHNIATAEWTIAAILASLKYLPFYAELQAVGNWPRRKEADQAYRTLFNIGKASHPPVLVEELAGKTVLIVGYGSIGKSIEDRLAPFSVEFLRVARRGRPGVEPVSNLNNLLPLADVVVLIVPLTGETTGMIATEQLALMKRGALLVNAARGPVVNSDALLAALQSGRIRAAVDVTDPEPLPQGHPLWRAPNLLITPHVAGSSPLFLKRSLALAAEQAGRYLAGDPLLNVVTGDY